MAPIMLLLPRARNAQLVNIVLMQGRQAAAMFQCANKASVKCHHLRMTVPLTAHAVSVKWTRLQHLQVRQIAHVVVLSSGQVDLLVRVNVS